MSVSTYFCSSEMPASAIRMRCAPSNWKGLVTTPTVRMPASRAARAITGPAPVPVPPPMPAVMNTMLAAAERLHDLHEGFLGGDATDVRARSRAQASGHADAELDTALAERLLHRLRVGVGNDEIAAHQVGPDHVVDRIAAGAADADDADAGLKLLLLVGYRNVDGHAVLRVNPH